MRNLISLSIALATFTQFNLKPIEIDLVQSDSTTRTLNEQNSRFLLATSVPLKVDTKDGDYLARIGLGTPSQTFDVQVDITTSVTWVPSSLNFNYNKLNTRGSNFPHEYNSNKNNTSLNNKTNSNDTRSVDQPDQNSYDQTKNNNNKNISSIPNSYDETKSSSGQNTNRSIKIEYEEGDVQGTWTYDKVDIANLTADGFAFVQVTEYDDDYENHKGGKLGLGLHSKHGEKFSILSVLQNVGLINKRMFSIAQSGNTKKLFIGDYPISTYFSLSKFSKCNVSSTEGLDDEYKDGWVCDISHVLLGNVKNLTQAIEVDGRVIFDTVYQYIRAPKNFNKYFKNFFTSKNITNCRDSSYEDEKRIVCSNKNDFSSLGSISFLLDGTAYKIAAEELFEQSGEGYEFLIRFSDDKENIWTLGAPFMNQYTVVFDMENFNVGFSGGEKVNYQVQWEDWYNGNSQADKANRFFYMIVGASIFGSILFIFIVFLIFHSIRRKKLEEHGPLINERH